MPGRLGQILLERAGGVVTLPGVIPGDLPRVTPQRVMTPAQPPGRLGRQELSKPRGVLRMPSRTYEVTFKGEAGAKDAGKLRLEGKEYIVREGDVMHFRFNV